MNEDLYLQRLRSIREKYTSTNKQPIEVRNGDITYRTYNVNPQINITRPKIEMTPTRPKPTQFQANRTPITRVERSYSLAENKPTPIISADSHTGDVSQKRMDNFTAFIRDLDQRIQEKERALSSKIKQNQAPPKPKEDPELDIMRTLNRYSSTKDIYKSVTPQIPESISRVVPREAYERSLAKKEEIQSRRNLSNHDIQNIMERKWAQESMGADKLKLMNAYRDNKLKINQYASPLCISKQDNLQSQDWSINKLDSIQKRIKAVLG